MNIRTVRLTPSRVAATWRAGEAPFARTSRAVVAAAAALIRRVRARRPDIRVSRISAAWLRSYEIESAKHRDDR